MPIPALLLTGGASRRMGSPKALIEIDGRTMAQNAAELLRRFCSRVIEVGPGYTDLEHVLEDQPGAGPLAAFIAGSAMLDEGTPLILMACDMPEVGDGLIEALANHQSGHAVVPFADGRLQTLCARYSAQARGLAPSVWESGGRSLRSLLDKCDVEILNEADWEPFSERFAFNDLDTPEDLLAYRDRRARS
ncbi:MAG: molybdenum cofactor guanylyltransferase [Actinomycetes bacterium]